MKHKYTADFETTTDPNDCRVWAWSITNIDNFDEKYFGNDIASFIQQLYKLSNCEVYFHNLKFDSQFIISHLFSAGYQHCKSGKLKGSGFTTMINGTGAIYQMKICFWSYTSKKRTYYRQCTIYDSLKKLPFKVEKIAKDFKLPIQKLELDYHAYRERHHIMTEEEKDYISNDTEIMARALAIQFEQGLKKMTIGSDALNSYKQIVGVKQFNRMFPVLDNEVDSDLRHAYHGGWTYVNPKYQGIDIGAGKVYDVNSLYPWAMRYNDYPVGEPMIGRGKYETDLYRPLYVQQFICEFELKEGYLPCVQIKNSMLYKDTEYLTCSTEPTMLFMCNVDLDLFFEHYDVYNIQYIKYWSFYSASDVFADYIDNWYKVKENATGSIRALAKLMLNNLYGKFATSPRIIEKKPVYVDGVVKYEVDEDYYKEGVYIPVGIFCTAYARNKTIRTAQKIYDRFMYADTDSLHVYGDEEPPELAGEIDDKKLGLWKNESNFVRARYIKAKSYVEEEPSTKEAVEASESALDYERDGNYYHLNVKCAGMSDAVKEKVTYDNFREGFTASGKLVPKNVKGGCVLEDVEFTIKPVLK